jgi:hypothetical protein
MNVLMQVKYHLSIWYKDQLSVRPASRPHRPIRHSSFTMRSVSLSPAGPALARLHVQVSNPIALHVSRPTVRLEFQGASTAASQASSAGAASLRSSHHASGWNQKMLRFNKASHCTSGSCRRTCSRSWTSTVSNLSAGQLCRHSGSSRVGRSQPIVAGAAHCGFVTKAPDLRLSWPRKSRPLFRAVSIASQ